MSNMKYIQVETHEDIAIIQINRPEALNAMNTDVISEPLTGYRHSRR